jgi:hypothetical protein
MYVMNTHRLLPFVTALLAIQIMVGCTMLGAHDESLPAGRNVKTVEFPVRHLTYSDIECRQEYERVELSGTITNASPYQLTDVGAKIIIFFAEGEAPKRISPFGTPTPFSSADSPASSRKVSVLATPSEISPHESTTFKMLTEVKKPVARIEIHGFWTKSN